MNIVETILKVYPKRGGGGAPQQRKPVTKQNKKAYPENLNIFILYGNSPIPKLNAVCHSDNKHMYNGLFHDLAVTSPSSTQPSTNYTPCKESMSILQIKESQCKVPRHQNILQMLQQKQL